MILTNMARMCSRESSVPSIDVKDLAEDNESDVIAADAPSEA